jgi:hypothetical protein
LLPIIKPAKQFGVFNSAGPGFALSPLYRRPSQRAAVSLIRHLSDVCRVVARIKPENPAKKGVIFLPNTR